MNNTSSNDNLSYCGALVRKHDPDRFLLSMFLDPKVRKDVWAVLAFNHEISKTREVVSESTLGLIRLQWWRDAVKDIYEEGKILEHEVVKPLAAAIKRRDLPRESFDKLLYAREFDLEDVLPGNFEGMMNYADFTTTPLFALIIKITGSDPDMEVIQPVAINYALSGILRATKSMAKQHRFLLPEDLMNRHSITKEGVFDDTQREGLKKIVEQIVTNRLEKTKPDHVFLKSSEVLSEMYFKQIKNLKYDVMDVGLGRALPFKVLKLFWKIKIM